MAMHMSYGVVPSRHIVHNTPIRALRTRLPKSYAFVVPSRHLAQRTCSNEALSPLCFLLCLRYFFLSPIHFSLSAQKKFVTKFVTKTILYKRKKYQAEKKNCLLKRKNYHGDARAVTRDRHEQCYTSNPSLMTGLEGELYTRNNLIYKQLQR